MSALCSWAKSSFMAGFFCLASFFFALTKALCSLHDHAPNNGLPSRLVCFLLSLTSQWCCNSHSRLQLHIVSTMHATLNGSVPLSLSFFTSWSVSTVPQYPGLHPPSLSAKRQNIHLNNDATWTYLRWRPVDNELRIHYSLSSHFLFGYRALVKDPRTNRHSFLLACPLAKTLGIKSHWGLRSNHFTFHTCVILEHID